jgi:hypothetical protein
MAGPRRADGNLRAIKKGVNGSRLGCAIRMAEEHRAAPMQFSRLGDLVSAVPAVTQQHLRAAFARNAFHSLAIGVGSHCRGLSLIKLTQGKGAQGRASRLQPASQQLIDLLSILLLEFNLKSYASAHSPIYRQNQHPTSICNGHLYMRSQC